jgi:hypothetical protein
MLSMRFLPTSTARPARFDNMASAPWRRMLAVVGFAGLTALSCMPGCAAQAAAPALASGERPVTGDARYDRFFAETNDLYLAVKEAKREELAVRGALARRVGLAGDAPLELLGARLRERTARLSEEGLTLQLEFTGIDETDAEEIADAEAAAADVGNDDGAAAAQSAEASAPNEMTPTATLRTPGREPERRELRLLKVLAQAALSGATIYADMWQVQRRTEALLTEASLLQSKLAVSFGDATLQERVRIKLTEAEDFLPGLSEQAEDVANAADVLISMLDEAANTAQPAPARRRPGGAKDGAARDAAGQAAPAERPQRRAAPKAPPAGAAAPGSGGRPATDFEP